MIDFTITIPSWFYEKKQAEHDLLKKIGQVPSQNLDRLHPSKKEGRPFAEYIDEGLWKSRVTYTKERSFVSFKPAEHRNPLKSLDLICEEELKRRFPDFKEIHGLKAVLKDKFPNFAKWWMGYEKFHQELTKREIDQFKRQISFSAIDRDDLICTPMIEDKELRSSLNLKDDSLLETHHLFAKNSPMNGKVFDRDGKIIHLSQGLASTSDRTVENTGNLRVVQTKKRESICYAGRPDTEKKALEQASFIFLNEIKTKRKGITERKDSQGNVIYQLDYAVNSLLSAPWIWQVESPLAAFPERKLLEEEVKTLTDLKNKGVVTIEDPYSPGVKYRVKFNPILFSNTFDGFERLKRWLPPFATGHSRSLEISDEGFSSLSSLLSASPAGKNIEAALQLLERHQRENHLAPEEELLLRDYLCKLLNLPTVYHCKSSLDRTSIPIALSTALQQWLDLQLPLPENICQLIDDFRFKELFAASWMAGHQITRYACNRKGTVANEKLKTKILGFTLQRGIVQNPMITRLLPERYLQDFPTAEKVKATAIYLGLVIPLTILFFLPLIVIAAGRHLAYLATGGKNRHLLGPLSSALPVLPFKLLFNFPSILPNKVLNEKSPQIKQRHIIAGKHK